MILAVKDIAKIVNNSDDYYNIGAVIKLKFLNINNEITKMIRCKIK